MGILGDITKFTSPTAVAEKLLGDVSKYKDVLKLDLTKVPFKFPPQVQQGIDLANKLGFKVPTEAELLKIAQGQLDPLLQGLSREIDNVLGEANKYLSKFKGLDPKTILSSLDWLFILAITITPLCQHLVS